MKAGRNKTIDIDIEAGRTYLDRCLRITVAQKSTDIIDKTILGDLFEVTSFFPVKFVDLLIADPPYNLDKNFHGNKFKKTSDELYEEYTEKWIHAVFPILKENATIYVCCDWASSPAIGRILKKYF